jgi:hypothetical protein
MAEYEKIKRMTFLLEGNHLLLVTTEVDADHNKIREIFCPCLHDQDFRSFYIINYEYVIYQR